MNHGFVAASDLLTRYDGFLLDAYGVLVDASGALPGAGQWIAALRRADKPFCVITNDASRSPIDLEARYRRLGLDIRASDVLTAGEMMVPYFAARRGARTAVLGTTRSEEWVTAGGGVIVPLGPGMELDAIAICDDQGYDFLRGMEWVYSAAVRALEDGRALSICTANPDLVYPRGPGEFGFTAGAVSLVIGTALERRTGVAPVIDVLGKPAPGLFVEGLSRLGLPATRVLMIGDQIETDVAGGLGAGLDVALVRGVSNPLREGGPLPTWRLNGFAAPTTS